MRFTGRARVAWRTFHWPRRIIIIIIMSLGIVALYSGIVMYSAVQDEKAEPCELTATPVQGTISSEIQKSAKEIEGVQDVTCVWDIPATLELEDYEAGVTLYGVRASYIKGEWLQGTVYPEDGTMPYLVLNKAAVLSFKNDKGILMKDAVYANWKNETVNLNDESKTVVRICGVIDDNQTSPRAYLSMNQVKNMRMTAGMESPTDTLWIRLENAGVREEVVNDLSKIGLIITIDDERDADWKLRIERSTLYMGTGGILISCGVILIVFVELLWRRDEKEALQIIEQLGMPPGAMQSVTRMRWYFTIAFACILGGIVIALI